MSQQHATQSLEIADLGGGVSELRLCRAPVNALTPGFLAEVAAALDGLEADPGVRAVLLSSPFKVFSAGLDLKEAQHFDLDQQRAIVTGLNVTFTRAYRFAKPLVAAVGGAAIAGGLFFVLTADHRVGAAGAKFGLAEVRVGATFPVGPLRIAQAELGATGARRLMLSGRPVGADDARALGIVDDVVARQDLAGTALAAARDLAAIPPRTYAAVKQQLRGPLIAELEAAMEAGANDPEGGWYNEETRAAMKAMIG